MTEPATAKSWIDRHLWNILGTGAVLFSGFLIGQTTTEGRVSQLELEVVALKAIVNEMHPRTK